MAKAQRAHEASTESEARHDATMNQYPAATAAAAAAAAAAIAALTPSKAFLAVVVVVVRCCSVPAVLALGEGRGAGVGGSGLVVAPPCCACFGVQPSSQLRARRWRGGTPRNPRRGG